MSSQTVTASAAAGTPSTTPIRVRSRKKTTKTSNSTAKHKAINHARKSVTTATTTTHATSSADTGATSGTVSNNEDTDVAKYAHPNPGPVSPRRNKRLKPNFTPMPSSSSSASSSPASSSSATTTTSASPASNAPAASMNATAPIAKNFRGWVPRLNYTTQSGPVLILQKKTFLRAAKTGAKTNYVVLADSQHNTILAEMPANAHNNKIFNALKEGSYYDMNIKGHHLQAVSTGWDETGLGRTAVIDKPTASTFKLRSDLETACTKDVINEHAPLDKLDWYPNNDTVVTIATLLDAKDTIHASTVTGFLAHHESGKVITKTGIPQTRHDYTFVGSDGATAVIRHFHQDGTPPILTKDDIYSVTTITAVIFNRAHGKFYLGKNALAFRAMESPEHNAIAELDADTLGTYIASSHPNARTIALADENETNGVTLHTLKHPVSTPVTMRLVIANIGGPSYDYPSYKNSKKAIKGDINPKLGDVIYRPKLSTCFRDVGDDTGTTDMWTTLWTNQHIQNLTGYTVETCAKADIEGDAGSQGMDLLRSAIGTSVIVTFITVVDKWNKTNRPSSAEKFNLVVENITANTLANQ